ncbi:sigma-54-dependent transcriptional regulator [Thalassobius sp. S69A]|uniref:sigma-54-dependent transcriptional regulator n=1 Tax=unclassified Thalassovita TaxID=2619711 RepID=UPI003C79D112
MIRKVLVVDDDAAVRDALGQTLELSDLAPIAVSSFIEAKDHISETFEGVVLSDIRMPGRDGFHLLEHAKSVDAELPVILLTGEGDIPMAVRALRAGANSFLEKPCAPEELLNVLKRALGLRAMVLENRRMKVQLETGDPAARLIFGSSDLAEGLRARVRIAGMARTEALVTGAPGTGISKVAEVIHLMSPLAKGPFVKRTATGLTLEALDMALDMAQGGSLFLDDIGNLPADTQFALLERLERENPVRLIAGTTVDLQEAVDAGRLNPELFYRLDVMQVRIPALSERRDDIPVMFRQYVEQASEQAGLTAPEITSGVLSALMGREWPGNARSLMSWAMRFVLGQGVAETDEPPTEELSLSGQMARVERSLLIAALRRAEGNATEAARSLEVPRKTFYDKLTRHGIKPEAYR